MREHPILLSAGWAERSSTAGGGRGIQGARPAPHAGELARGCWNSPWWGWRKRRVGDDRDGAEVCPSRERVTWPRTQTWSRLVHGRPDQWQWKQKRRLAGRRNCL